MRFPLKPPPLPSPVAVSRWLHRQRWTFLLIATTAVAVELFMGVTSPVGRVAHLISILAFTGFYFLLATMIATLVRMMKTLDTITRQLRGIADGGIMMQNHGETHGPYEPFYAGACALCAEALGPASGAGIKCLSGHLIHCECLTLEPGRPPRCPVCLQNRESGEMATPTAAP